MANGLLQHSQGQRPWMGVSVILVGQRPYSMVMFWIEYGRWPKGFVWVWSPGAMPLAMISMAVGQKCDQYVMLCSLVPGSAWNEVNFCIGL